MTWEMAEQELERARPEGWNFSINRSTTRTRDLLTRKFTITIEEHGITNRVFQVENSDKLRDAVYAVVDHWQTWKQRRLDGVLVLNGG